MEGDNQRSYTDAHGTKYYYIVEFENGWKGEVASMKADTYPLPPGTEVEITVTRSAVGNKMATYSVQKPKGGSKGSGGGAGGWDDPVQTLRIAMGICQECAILTYVHTLRNAETPEDMTDFAQFYFAWVTDSGKIKDRATVTLRWYAIRNAVNSMQGFEVKNFLPNKQMNPTAGFSSDNIILMAERWLLQMEKITE